MIEAQHIAFRYPGQDLDSLEDVSVEVRPGEVVGIVGPNGSGKSTLGRLLKGLLLPSDGRVLVDGLDTRVDGLEVRRRVGLVFQNPNSQIVNSIVEQEVAFGPENLGVPPIEIRQRVDEALAAVDLVGLETAECHGLNMANKQRVAIAAVMAMKPQFVILDEATAWLEPSSRWPMLEEVLRWGKQCNAGLIFITHRMDEAYMCHRLYGMLAGRIEIAGDVDAVLGNATVRERLALEVPETLHLAEILREAGVPIGPRAGIGELTDAIWQS